MWHALSSFGIMFAVLTWSQESLVIDDTETMKGWKGLLAVITGFVLYWLFPHRMYHFFDEAPFADRTAPFADVAGVANAGTFVRDGQKYTTTVVSGPEGHYRVAVPFPELVKPGVLPEFFEIQNVPYTYLYWRQWAWIIWHYLSSFAIMFAILSWFQEAEVLEAAVTFEGWKGILALGTGLVLYWLCPHRMFYFHEQDPCTK